MRNPFGATAKSQRSARRQERHATRAQRRHDIEAYYRSEADRRSGIYYERLFDSDEAVNSGLPLFSRKYMLNDHLNITPIRYSYGATTFLRPVRLILPSDYNGETLRELVDTGNDHLEKVAFYCGALVVSHDFGLYDARDQIFTTYDQCELIPKGYVFAASVEKVSIEAYPLTGSDEELIQQGIAAYDQSTRITGLKDIHSSQFALGQVATDSVSQRYLLDIDLRFI